MTHKIKERMRRSLLGTTLFENLGFTYLGPVDGHDVSKSRHFCARRLRCASRS
ncbi:MAG: 1-deoxy-D-xylulose-5-phosphate synthase N-terminal domain-containing protein [Oscillospiraceae bacterium]